MAEPWVTVPLEQLVKHRSHGDGVRTMRRCNICNSQTVPNTEQTADEQIMLHLQRTHSIVSEAVTGRLPPLTRAKLIALGWAPPVDDGTARPDPDTPPRPASG